MSRAVEVTLVKGVITKKLIAYDVHNGTGDKTQAETGTKADANAAVA